MVAPRELVKGGDFFRGRYSLQTGDMENVFGNDGEAFHNATSKLGGQKTDKADFSVKFHVLPKLAVEYLLWLADDEFRARVTILLDRETCNHFPPDATFLLINLLTGRILSSVL